MLSPQDLGPVYSLVRYLHRIELASELYPNVAAVGAAYGDRTGKHAVSSKEEEDYPRKPYFLWYQLFSDSGLVQSGDNAAPLMVSPKDVAIDCMMG
jgi:hypothetical protein